MSRTANHSILYLSEAESVVGNFNVIYGSHLTITGDDNIIHANASSITGNRNVVKGNDCVCIGEDNVISTTDLDTTKTEHVGDITFA